MTIVPLAGLWIFAAGFLMLVSTQGPDPDSSVLNNSSAVVSHRYENIIWRAGLVGWAIALVASLSASFVCWRSDRRKAAAMLGQGAGLTTIFLVSDLFQPGPRWPPTTATVTTTLVALAATGAWFVLQREELTRTRVELVATAAASFACATITRLLAPPLFGVDVQQAFLAGVVVKYLGLLAWALYFLLTSIDIVRSVVMSRRTSVLTQSRPVQDLGQPPTEVTVTPRKTPSDSSH